MGKLQPKLDFIHNFQSRFLA